MRSASETPHPALPRLFVIFAVFFGLTFAFLTAPFGVPDEPHHFMRAFQISQGQWLPTFHDNIGGAMLPSNVVKLADLFNSRQRYGKPFSLAEIQFALNIPLDPTRRVYVEFSNTSAYSPLLYLPQSIAICAGRALGLTVLKMTYLGRLANLATWIIAGYFALRWAPRLRPPLFLLLLMPMCLYEAASLSADVVAISLPILFTIAVWREATSGDAAMKPHRFWLLIALAAAMGLAKFVYLPLTILTLLIPASFLGSNHRKRLLFAAVVLAALLPAVYWCRQTPGLDMIANGLNVHMYPRLQLEFLHQNPQGWIILPYNTLRYDFAEQFTSFVGEFGWMDAPFAFLPCLLYYLALLLSCRPAKDEAPLIPLSRWTLIPAVAIALSVFTLGLTAYLYWNALGAKLVLGLQGRYFIPVAPAAFIFIIALWLRLPPRTRYRPTRSRILIMALIPIFTLAYATYVIYLRFYTATTWFNA